MFVSASGADSGSAVLVISLVRRGESDFSLIFDQSLQIYIRYLGDDMIYMSVTGKLWYYVVLKFFRMLVF